MVILFLIFGALAFIAIRFFIQYQKVYKLAKQFSGPIDKASIFIGNVRMFPSDMPGIFKMQHKLHQEYGKTFFMRGINNSYTLQTLDVNIFEQLLSSSKPVKKSIEYEFLIPWLGTGLLIASDLKWFNRRKIITPTFHFKVLDEFIEVFNRQSKKLAEKLKPHQSGGDIDVYHYSTLAALDIVCETSMGTSVNAQDQPNSRYVKAVKEISNLFLKRIFSITRAFPWIYDFTPMGRQQIKLLKELHEFTIGVIQKRREVLLKNNNNSNNAVTEEDEFSRKKTTFLDMLLQATIDGKPLTNADIREEVDTFMFEGHDTTTTAIAMCLFELARHPEIQETVYQELKDICGDSPIEETTHNQYSNMKYFEMVIKETMRMYPSVPTLGRLLIEDTEIDGVILPKGSNVHLQVYGLHHDPEYYPEPEKFDPLRFELIETKKRHPYAYVPFSAGPRNCIGQKFAMLVIKSTVGALLRSYKLLPPIKNTVDLQADIILKSANGVNIRVIPRN